MTNQSQQAQAQAPYSLEAEQALLGALLLEPRSFLSVAAFLNNDDFFLKRHEYIWMALSRLQERNDPMDYVTVTQELQDMRVLSEIGGQAYLTSLVNNTPSAVHAEVYGRLVERASIRRRMLKATDEIRNLAMDEEMPIDRVISDAEQVLFSVSDSQIKREFVPMWDAVSEYYDDMEKLLAAGEGMVGLPTGFKALDGLLGGFQKSDLIVFAGRPGMGKCVTGDTLIATSQGMKPIEHLKPDTHGIPDDEGGVFYPLTIGVQTPNGIKQTSHFYDSGVKPTLKITTQAGYSLAGTHNHPVMTRHANWVTLSKLQVGDLVMVHNGRDFDWQSITAISENGLQHCYDLTVPDGHAFVANGIVSHNTSWLLTVALNAARRGARVALFTMEMGVEQMIQRFISMETGIRIQQLRTANISPREHTRFTEAVGRIANLPIFIDDTPAINPIEMRTKCRRLQHEYGLDLVMVDYMQLMSAGKAYENNRVQEISYISRSLKELARELNVTMLSAAQLSRAVEQRQDKRPQLSDLRESGCLSGETQVYLPDKGYSVPIESLVGQSGFRVLSLDPDTYKLQYGTVTNAFCTGTKAVYRMTTALGRTIRATGNHKFLTINGWQRLDELELKSHIALPRTLPEVGVDIMKDSELALMGHLIGDGCTLPRHAIQYTTVEYDLAELVAELANDLFYESIAPRIQKEKNRSWYQVFLPTTKHITHNVRNPISVWLDEHYIFGLRSHEKFVPQKVFGQSDEKISLFLRHLWSTDGCINLRKTTNGHAPIAYYATSSSQLATDVAHLLLRLSMNARIKLVSQGSKGRDQYHVILTGHDDLTLFSELVGAVGKKKLSDLRKVQNYLVKNIPNTNRDVIPRDIWRKFAVPSMQTIGMKGRQMQSQLGNSYCGTTLYKQNVSRDRAMRLAQVVESDEIHNLANSDVYWDKIVSIEPDGETAVYDLTVDTYHNFCAEMMIVHNSIEQDADAVMFLYRDEVYNPDTTEFPNQADVLLSKHRHGPTGTIQLYFEKSITKFMDVNVAKVDLSDLE